MAAAIYALVKIFKFFDHALYSAKYVLNRHT
jgi:hypothetical protein